MFDFEKPKIEIKEMSEDNRYGKFVVEPLERGYGITLGNSLRRIMLSSLPGAAVSQIKIEGRASRVLLYPGSERRCYKRIGHECEEVLKVKEQDQARQDGAKDLLISRHERPKVLFTVSWLTSTGFDQRNI